MPSDASSSDISDSSGEESPAPFVARTPDLSSDESQDEESEHDENDPTDIAADAEVDWEDVRQFKKRFVKWDATYVPIGARFSGKRRARRRHRRLRLPEDATSYDRPDLYASDVVNYMGLYLAKGRVGKHVDAIRGVELRPHEKVLLFQVDGVDSAVTDEEIFDKWQAGFCRRNNLPTALTFADNDESEIFHVDYAAPIGDEWNFHQNPLFSQWIGGDQCLGRVWISPTQPPLKTMTQFPETQNDWVKDLSFRTFLRVNFSGVKGQPPRFLKATDRDDPSMTLLDDPTGTEDCAMGD